MLSSWKNKYIFDHFKFLSRQKGHACQHTKEILCYKKHLWSHILGKDLVKSSLTSAEAGESSEPVRNRRGCGWLLLLFEVTSADPVLFKVPRTAATAELTASVATFVVTADGEAVLTSELVFPPFSLSFFLEEDLRTSRRSLSLSDKRRRRRTSDWAVEGDEWYGP